RPSRIESSRSSCEARVLRASPFVVVVMVCSLVGRSSGVVESERTAPAWGESGAVQARSGGRPRASARDRAAHLAQLGVAGEDSRRGPGQLLAEAGPVEDLADPPPVGLVEAGGGPDGEGGRVHRDPATQIPSPSPQNRGQSLANQRRFWLIRPGEQPYLAA